MKPFLFFFMIAFAQQLNAQDAVAVRNEPFHKNVFENEYLRVLDVRILPGDTSLFHKHETPSVFISLHPVKTGSQVIIEDGTATILSLDRTISFEGFYKSPRIHRVWNADTSVFHVMDIELLAKGNTKIEAPITRQEFKQVFDASPVRAYRVTLQSNQEIEIKINSPVLVVGLEDAGKVMVNNKLILKEGNFLFIGPNEKIKLVNKEKKEYAFAFLQLK